MGIRKDMGRRAQGTDITLCGGPAGELSRGLVYRGLAKALETGTFLQRGPVTFHGGPLTGNSEGQLKGSSGNGASLWELY